MSNCVKNEQNSIFRVSVKMIIEEIQRKTEVFRSSTGEAFIKMKDDNRISPINGEDFEYWLRGFCYYQMDNSYPSAGAVAQVAGHLKMLAMKSPIKKIHRRICSEKNTIYYDLGTDDYTYLKITKDDIKTVKNRNLLMMRNEVFCPQIMPDLDGSPSEIPDFVKKHFHFSSDSENLLFSVFLVATFFMETMSRPIIQLYGEKASGKTVCEKRVLDLINPVSSSVCALPKKMTDVVIRLSYDYMVAFDNVGWIPDDISNLLCMVSTGGMISTRKFFTNAGQVFMEPKAIVLFNSVHQCVTKSDLADRIITFHLERFSQEARIGEMELEREWEKDKPRFFGDICLAVQGVLGDETSAEYNSPFRLVDFYELAEKIGRQLGYETEDVYWAFDENHKTINDAIVTGDIVMTVIECFMAKQESDTILEFSPTDFYRELKDYAYEEIGISYSSFPRSPSALSRKMKDCRSNLEEIGIYFEKGKSCDRKILIWKK